MFLRLIRPPESQKNLSPCDNTLFTLRLGLNGRAVKPQPSSDKGLVALPFHIFWQTDKTQFFVHKTQCTDSQAHTTLLNFRVFSAGGRSILNTRNLSDVLSRKIIIFKSANHSPARRLRHRPGWSGRRVGAWPAHEYVGDAGMGKKTATDNNLCILSVITAKILYFCNDVAFLPNKNR